MKEANFLTPLFSQIFLPVIFLPPHSGTCIGRNILGRKITAPPLALDWQKYRGQKHEGSELSDASFFPNIFARNLFATPLWNLYWQKYFGQKNNSATPGTGLAKISRSET